MNEQITATNDKSKSVSHYNTPLIDILLFYDNEKAIPFVTLNLYYLRFSLSLTITVTIISGNEYSELF